MPCKTAEPTRPAMLHRPQLRARGWTTALIGRFLPPPEETRPNPMGRSRPPVRLWRPETIEAIEATPEFRTEFAAAARRKESARKAVETRLAAMHRWIDELEVELPDDLDQAELTRLAIRSFNNRGLDRLCEGRIDHFREATEDSDPRFLARITVNFIRHATNYEEALDRTFGRTGAEQAYGRIKAEVLDAIAAKWPGLADECVRQKGPVS